jgi:hypothetical protein
MDAASFLPPPQKQTFFSVKTVKMEVAGFFINADLLLLCKI